jgi:hypothetical protein
MPCKVTHAGRNSDFLTPIGDSCKLSYHSTAAASIAATSILRIVIIAANARAATSPPYAIAFVRTCGVICQCSPYLSLHQPQALSAPPLPTIAFQYRSVSACESVPIWNENASLCGNIEPPFRPMQGTPTTVNSTVSTSPFFARGVVSGSAVDGSDFAVGEKPLHRNWRLPRHYYYTTGMMCSLSWYFSLNQPTRITPSACE